MGVKKQCYDAGIKAIQHIIDTRVQKNKKTFRRLDEDKDVPFVVPFVSWDREKKEGSLNNEHWKFQVNYGFREALDLLFIDRVRNKQKVNLWSQGCIISFKEGDLINSHCGRRSVQVKFAVSMGWNNEKNEMDYGLATYKEMDLVSGLSKTKTLNQLEFLNMLIEG